MTRNLIEFAAEQQRSFDASTFAHERKQRGHFGTPPAIAEFMAAMFREIPKGIVHVLDPGAGVGMLSAAVCQRVLKERGSHRLAFELWENDPKLELFLHKTMEGCRNALQDRGHEMGFTIHTGDFVLEHAQPSLFHAGAAPRFDFAITNPPYYKVRKDSAQARVMEHVVHGQPNIYPFFLAIATDLLIDGGQMVAITPRSYFNGPYFKRFRKWFFDRMAAQRIHVFDSRKDAFCDDEVLQENVILLAEKGEAPKDVILTSSEGRDFEGIEQHAIPYTKVVENSSGDHLVRVAPSRLEQQVVELVDELPCRFRQLGFEISTGPIVTFRSTKFLRHERAENTAPLLWMHNVRPFVTQFPPNKNGKPAHVLVSDESSRLLLPANRYVLLKRFTAKEERRRLIAGIMEAGDSYSHVVGLENHLNYVYRPSGQLSKQEAFGLAAFFNSALVDRYFRAVSGNTQVNAAEVRAMPLPELETIRQIGQTMEQSEADAQVLEWTIGKALGLERHFIEQLCEFAQ